MSAECEKHGVDLHGDTFSGLVCPVCKREREIKHLRGLLKRALEAMEKHTIGLRRDHEHEHALYLVVRQIRHELGGTGSAEDAIREARAQVSAERKAANG